VRKPVNEMIFLATFLFSSVFLAKQGK